MAAGLLALDARRWPRRWPRSARRRFWLVGARDARREPPGKPEASQEGRHAVGRRAGPHWITHSFLRATALGGGSQPACDPTTVESTPSQRPSMLTAA